MSIYIIQPQPALSASRIEFMAKKLGAASREKQVTEMLSLRKSDPVDGEIRRWLKDVRSYRAAPTAKNARYARITGTVILEMTAKEAERLRRELTGVVVLQDRTLELIQPRRAVAATKKKITARDLWHLKAIGLETARQRGFKGAGKNVTIAVLDTGIDETHTELAGKISQAYTFDVKRWKAKRISPSYDTDGHGTHVAGLICGKQVGVAPGAKIFNGIMLPHGRGSLSSFILALEWVGSQPEVQIINMSAGLSGYLPEMRAAVAGLPAVGVLPVFATGNEGRNRTRSPGNYDEPVSVGATNRKDRVAGFSSGGSLIVDNHQYVVPDLVAPGAGVYSSIMGGGYEAWDGTSMATPIAAGVAALILEKHPDIAVTDLVDELLTTCKNLGQSADRQGNGLVQVKAAL